MTHTLTKLAVTTFTPAVREVIGQPAHTYAVSTRTPVTKYPPDYVSGGLVVNYGPNGVIGYTWVRPSGSAPYIGYEDVITYVNVPGVEAVKGRDAEVVVDNQLGWTGSARSIALEGADLFAEFQIPAGAIGVAAGLVTPGATSLSLGSIEHGFLSADGSDLQVIEGGVPVHTVDTVVHIDSVYQLVRLGSQVDYRVDGVTVFTSTKPSAGNKVLGAVLYSGGDSIDNPAFDTSIALGTTSDWNWSDAFSVGRVQAESSWSWQGEATVNDGAMRVAVPMTLRMNELDYGSMELTLSYPDVAGSSGFTQVTASGLSTSVPLTFAMGGVDVDLGQMHEDFGLHMVSADYDYGSMRLVMGGPDVLGVEFNDPPNTANTFELLICADTWHTDPVLYATINETLGIADSMEILLTMDGTLSEFLGISEDTTAAAIIRAMLNSNLRFTDNASSVNNLVHAALRQYMGDTSVQYATNLNGGAVARYEGFDFGGFCSARGDTYGWKPDGLYKIGAGEGDNGNLISALIDFAAEDLGTSTRKRLTSIYMGLATDGQVYVQMTDDRDQNVTYRAKQRGSEYRSDMQQGTSSRFWRLRLELVDASYAELDNIEWLAGSTSRRTTK